MEPAPSSPSGTLSPSPTSLSPGTTKDPSPTFGPAPLRSLSLLPSPVLQSIRSAASTDLLVLLVSSTRILSMSSLCRALVLRLGLLLVILEVNSLLMPTSWDSNGTLTEAAQPS